MIEFDLHMIFQTGLTSKKGWNREKRVKNAMTKPLNEFWTVWQTVENKDWQEKNRDKTGPILNGNVVVSVPIQLFLIEEYL